MLTDIHIYTSSYKSTFMYVQIFTCVHSLTYICIHEYIHVHININSNMYIGTYTHTHMQDACVHIMTINTEAHIQKMLHIIMHHSHES